MEVNAVKAPIDLVNSAYGTQLASPTQPNNSVSTSNAGKAVDKRVTAPTDGQNAKEPVDLQDVAQATEAMNKFVQAIDAKIRFALHEGTKELMVQVIDQSNDKILKEFPPHEFLDTMAAIRDYVGMLLDKRI